MQRVKLANIARNIESQISKFKVLHLKMNKAK